MFFWELRPDPKDDNGLEVSWQTWFSRMAPAAPLSIEQHVLHQILPIKSKFLKGKTEHIQGRILTTGLCTNCIQRLGRIWHQAERKMGLGFVTPLTISRRQEKIRGVFNSSERGDETERREEAEEEDRSVANESYLEKPQLDDSLPKKLDGCQTAESNLSSKPSLEGKEGKRKSLQTVKSARCRFLFYVNIH